MAYITKLVEGRNQRISVYLDDQFVCFLNNFTVFKHKLKVGTEISMQQLNNIQLETELDTAFNLAVNYLSKYEKTEKEIGNYLISKGFLPEVKDAVLSKLKDYKYVNDLNFCENFFKMSQNKYGKNKIKMLLKQKGVSEEVINQTQLKSPDGVLDALAVKYMKNKEKTAQNKQKCAKFLLGRGFSWDEVSATLRKLDIEDENESWE